jgi:O-antigen/teichoic acid export membrane protein
VTPVFQLKRRTWPVIICAALALVINAALVLPLGSEAKLADYARAQSFAYGAALLAAASLALAQLRVLPSPGDLAKAAAALALMALAAWPFRGMAPGVIPLIASIVAGGLAFAAVAAALDMGGIRSRMTGRLRRKTVAA